MQYRWNSLRGETSRGFGDERESNKKTGDWKYQWNIYIKRLNDKHMSIYIVVFLLLLLFHESSVIDWAIHMVE